MFSLICQEQHWALRLESDPVTRQDSSLHETGGGRGRLEQQVLWNRNIILSKSEFKIQNRYCENSLKSCKDMLLHVHVKRIIWNLEDVEFKLWMLKHFQGFLKFIPILKMAGQPWLLVLLRRNWRRSCSKWSEWNGPGQDHHETGSLSTNERPVFASLTNQRPGPVTECAPSPAWWWWSLCKTVVMLQCPQIFHENKIGPSEAPRRSQGQPWLPVQHGSYHQMMLHSSDNTAEAILLRLNNNKKAPSVWLSKYAPSWRLEVSS